MTQAAKIAPSPSGRAALINTIAIASGKGGVGKTWLSITLCHALARAGCKTLLFDGDLGLANVDVQLGLTPRLDLGGVLAGQARLGDATLAYGTGGFDIIAGQSGSGSLANLPADRLGRLLLNLADLTPSYDWAVLDLGAGIERTVRQLAARAQTCLVVTTDEPTSMTDAYAFIKLSVLNNRQADLRLVVNMVDSQRAGEVVYQTVRKACESFLKFTPALAGIIRRDTKVKDTIRHQAPLLVRHPNTAAASDVERLAEDLMRTR